MPPANLSGGASMPPANLSLEQDGRLPSRRSKLACDECRKRKLRCDGQDPQCGVCAEAGITCKVNTKRPARGPKKGLLRALRIKASELQHRLDEREAALAVHDDTQDDTQVGLDSEADMNAGPSTNTSSLLYHGAQSPSRRNAEVPAAPREGADLISDFTSAELNQLYFERVHPFTPFIQRRHFLSWSHRRDFKRSRLCLQLAMRTLAASLSAQYQHIRLATYQNARKELEDIEIQGTGLDSVDVEQAQAWILVAFYELIRAYYRRAWMSIGRACRLIQLMGLHKIDAVEKITNGAEATPRADTETEEKRRTFWMAYCLDRLVGIRNNWPLAFNELVICTRLPASETDFQNGGSSLGGFLSEAITADSGCNVPAFNELIVYVTICGRCLSHKQQAAIEPLYGSLSQDFWDRHEWLHALLTQKLERSRMPSSPSNMTDPMRLFANMVAHTALIYLCKIPNSSPNESINQQSMSAYEEESRAAALEIANLAQNVDELSIFKAHPLSPYPVFSAAEFLAQESSPVVSYESELQKLVTFLETLKPVSDLAEHYLQQLEFPSPLN